MALTRKFLKAMGLTDEQVESVIEAHTETVNGLTADRDKYKTDAEKLPGVQKQLDDLKAEGDGGYKKKYEDLVAENSAKETRKAKETAFRNLLKSAGVSEKYIDRVVEFTKIDDLELDGDKVKDEAARIEAVKKDWPEFISTTTSTGANTSTPPANNTTPEEPKSLADALRDRYRKD